VDAAAERGRAAVAAIPLVLVPALGAVQGGFDPDSWVWAGALAAWGAALALVLSSDPGAWRRGWLWASAGGAFLVWTLLSAVWSVRPSQSVLEARRTLVYAAVILALLLLARRGATRVLMPATTVAISGLVLYALVRYLVSSRRVDQFELRTLNQPLGYANAVGILAVLGMLLALGIASRAESPRWRIGAAALVPPLAFALKFSDSTASWLALGIGIAVAALLDRAPLRLLVTLAAVAPPGGALVLLGRISRFADPVASTPRIGGPVLVLAAGVAGVTGGALVWWLQGRRSAPAGRGRRLVVAAVIFAALACAAAVARSGATEPRSSYWHVAWHDEYRAHPLLGSGAGTFAYYWQNSGRQVELGGALDAHSLYLETLAELGPLGLLLLLAMLLVPFRSARSGAAYVPAALGAYAAFLVHAGLDWDWELPAVIVAGLCCGAAALTADVGPEEQPLGTRTRALLLVIAVVLAGCAIAGARSHAFPSAETEKAPQSGAFSQTRVRGAGYLP
jgi:O-antigen ligase